MKNSESTLFHEKFLRFAEAEPSAPAVEFRDRVLTYGEVAELSGRVAAFLRDGGAGAETIIGISAAPSPEWVVAVLGVLRAGAAWLPLDPAYPQDRLKYMIEDSGTRLVLADAGARRRIEMPGTPFVDISAAERPVGTGELTHGYEREQLAYVIYTSGSLGKPKGVQLTQRALANFGDSLVEAFDARRGHRVLQFASSSFDVSVLELVMALQAGATFVVPPNPEIRFGEELAGFLRTARITHAFLPPSVVALLPLVDLPDLEVLICGGEALPEAVVEKWAPRHRLVNAYGPTEATVWGSSAEMTAGTGKPLIGRAVKGARLAVLDDVLRPVPGGTDGELAIGGPGVARGYLGQPALTAERFVPDPDVPGGRRYRTGDLVRSTPSGDLDFLGRIDDQVKLRGYRIEPEEIANILRSHPAVLDATVLIRAVAGEDRLLAYVVAPDEAAEELRNFVGSRVPAYMVPTLVPVASLPLTPNGKVDRDALPMPDRLAAGSNLHRVQPRTETERLIAEVISEMLGIEQPSVDDDFFMLGGHSLLAGRLAARVRTELGRELPIAEVYRNSTIEGIAAAIDQVRESGPELPALVRVPRDQPLPLSFPQERIWFLEQLSPGNLAYNMQIAVRLRGPLDPRILEATLAEIVRRHEVLRTEFGVEDGSPVQRPREDVTVMLPVVELGAELDEAGREAAEARLIKEFVRRPFDLSDPPLARWLLIRHAPGDHTLIQVEHHFVHDGWSLSVLLGEIEAIYPALAAGKPHPLPPPPVQYADFAAWQRAWMRGDVLQRYVDYWTNSLRGAPFTVDLPTDRPRPPAHSFTGDALRLDLPVELGRALRAGSRESGVTLFATMFAGFAALLGRYSGQRDLVIGTGAANRRLAETEKMIGMVVNTLPLRVDLAAAGDFDALRRQVHAVTAEGSNWQDVPLDRLVEALALPRDPSRNPVFQTLFSFHDSAVPDLRFAGIEGAVHEMHNGSAKMDINIVVIPRAQQRTGREHDADDDRITMIWEYSGDLYDRDTIERMVGHYFALLADGIRHPHRELGRLRLTDRDEAAETAPAAGPEIEFPGGLLPELVDGVAREAGGVAAVVDAVGGVLSYRDLVGRANHLALRLQAVGVGPDVPVGVWMDRSVERVVVVLAVVKAGGAFLPLDPELPFGRVTRLLARAGASVVCVDGSSVERFTKESGIAALDCAPGRLTEVSETAPEAVVRGAHLASVYFTSGPAEEPKAVASTHAGWVNRMQWMRERYPLRRGERVLHQGGAYHDDSAVEVFWPLISGGTVAVLPPGLHRDPRAIAEHAEWHRVVGLQLAPSVLPSFCDEVTEERRAGLASLRYVISSGEALSPDLVERFHGVFGATGAALSAHWGPTGIGGTSHTCAAANRAGARLPLGEPVANTRVWLLDEQLMPVPVGVPGEVYLSGAGLARGYLDDPRRTAEAFVPDPSGAGHRLYRTGDRALRRKDGVLTLLAGNSAAAEREIGYRALAQETATTTPTPPQTETEHLIAELWSDALQRDDIDIHTNFFTLGGYSLLATKVIGRLRTTVGAAVPLATIFNNPTVHTMATAVEKFLLETFTDAEIASALGEEAARS